MVNLKSRAVLVSLVFTLPVLEHPGHLLMHILGFISMYKLQPLELSGGNLYFKETTRAMII